MAAFTRFDTLTEDLAHGLHNLAADPLKVMLSNVEPTKDLKTKSEITEIAPGNGYEAGGKQVIVTSSSQKSGVYRLIIESVTFAANNGSFGPFRSAVLYNAKSNRLIGWSDYSESLSTHHSDSFAVQFDSVNGVYVMG